eukprot:189123_1
MSIILFIASILINNNAELITCGDTITNILNQTNQPHSYTIISSETSKINLNTCNTNNHYNTTIQIILYSHSQSLNVPYCTNCGACNNNTKLNRQLTALPIIEANKTYTFLVNASHIGPYQIDIQCVPVTYAPTYKIIHTASLSLEQSQLQCENNFGTSLATIIGNDFIETKYILQNWTNAKTWIGFYKDRAINASSKWKWIHETPFINSDYTGACMMDSQFCWEEILFKHGRVGMLIFMDEQNNISLIPSESSSTNSSLILCNAPTGKYASPRLCTTPYKCWNPISSDTLTNIKSQTISDILFDVHKFKLMLAVWNGTMFLLGIHQIHYASLDLIAGDYVYTWKHIEYNNNFDTISTSNRVTQYESSLYIYIYHTHYEELLHFDMETFAINSSVIPYQAIPKKQYVCLVSSSKYVFVLKDSLIWKYDIINNEWLKTNVFGYEPTVCIIDSDETFIYVFSKAQDLLYKYDIELLKFEFLNEPNLCKNGIGMGITAKNGKAYIIGCNIPSWKTLVFNMETETFESETLSVADPKTIQVNNSLINLIPYYRSSIITSVDDNVLMMATFTDAYYPLQTNTNKHQCVQVSLLYTDPISINFEETETFSNNIWPSDGITVRYYVINSYSETLHMMPYYVRFYSGDTETPINESVTLNITQDGCICTLHPIRRCDGCKQHFPLSNLIVSDNQIKILTLHVSSINTFGNSPLIVSTDIKLRLQHCTISLNTINRFSTGKNPYINITFNLSDECFTRIGYAFAFTLSIMSLEPDIKCINTSLENCSEFDDHNVDSLYKVIISIDNGRSYICDQCFNNIISLRHTRFEKPKTLKIMSISNDIDLIVDTIQPLEVQYNPAGVYNDSDSIWYGFVIICSVILVMFCAFIIMCCITKKNDRCKCVVSRKNGDIKSQRKYIHYIKNPMVIAITILKYESYPKNADLKLMDCPPDLLGIDVDYTNISKLCKMLNYDLYPKSCKLAWTQDQIINCISEQAQYVSSHLDTLNENKNLNKTVNGYDSILVIISGHGMQGYIITSDIKLVSKTAIHRMLSTNFPELRNIPRICIFDVCDGNLDRSHDYSNEYKQDKCQDSGKLFQVDDIKVKQSSIWKKDQQNVDYKLSVINASNEGFQAKMNVVDGSYLTYEFVKRMMENIQQKKDLFFGDIIDGIQEDLHHRGKQQITATFHNGTRYLRFKVNKEQKEIILEQLKKNKFLIGESVFEIEAISDQSDVAVVNEYTYVSTIEN